MATIAVALYLSYLVTAFGLRTWLQYRRTGSTGLRGVSGRPGSLEWCGGALFVLALLAGLAGPLLQLADAVDPLEPLDVAPVHVAGLVLAGVGIVATLLAQHAMGTSWRVGVDQQETTALVTTGPFTLARNPIFTAMIGTGTGLTALTPNLVALGGLTALVVAIEIQVRAVEEPYLLRAHGRAYSDYASRTGRFVPGVGCLPPRSMSSDDRVPGPSAL
jgi:protein-S-isoprenylcysteine O-methyltransferase Ste14